MTDRKVTMMPPPDVINAMYDLCNVTPGVPVEVYVRDLEMLKAEGWTSTEPEPVEVEPPLEGENDGY